MQNDKKNIKLLKINKINIIFISFIILKFKILLYYILKIFFNKNCNK